MFTVASFDVGIKNLAFCIMQYNCTEKSGKQFPILCWKNMDLTDKYGIGDHHCSGIVKKTNLCCRAPAKLKINERYFCSRHNPDRSIKPKSSPKVKNIPLDRLCITLASRLDEFSGWWENEIDEIIIETQYSRNRKMICLSNMVYSYFIMKWIMNKDSRLKKIKFVSSRNKLKVYDGPTIKSTRKDKKDQRKQLAVEHCKYMIRGEKDQVKFLMDFPKKKDDLSDSFLQGAWYLKFACKTKIKPNKKTEKKVNKDTSIVFNNLIRKREKDLIDHTKLLLKKYQSTQ